MDAAKSLILLPCTFNCLFSPGQSRHKTPPGFYCFIFCTSFLCNYIYNYRKDRIIHHFAQALSPAVIHRMMLTLSYHYFFIHHTLSLFFIHSGISVLMFPVFEFLLSSNAASESEVTSQALGLVQHGTGYLLIFVSKVCSAEIIYTASAPNIPAMDKSPFF